MDVPLLENQTNVSPNNGTHIKYNPDLEWKSVINKTLNSEAIWICDKCGKESLIHPHYINAGLKPCVRSASCSDIVDIIKQMLDLKGYILIKTECLKGRKVYFICGNGHVMNLLYDTLRKGASCKHCNDDKRRKEPLQKILAINEKICECNTSTCIHYSYLACYPGAAIEWNYKKNHPVRPENVAPKSGKEYWHTCPNEWCLMDYIQIIYLRTFRNARCPYCSGRKACHWNNLQENFPELCKEFDPANTVKAIDILPNYTMKVGWICGECGHKWNAAPTHRTSHNSGCPKCNRVGYAQQVGGHEFFLQEVRQIHGDNYEYRELYQGCKIPLGIFCPKLDKYGKIHDIFLQTPDSHKRGSGCPKCVDERIESKYIKQLQEVLDNLNYIKDVNCFHEHSFPSLIYKLPLRVDRYLNEPNLVIERDGEYHFRIVNSRGGYDAFVINQQRDITKDIYCMKNGINLFRIPYTTTPIREMIEKVVELCKIHKQVYISYRHYIAEVIKHVDLTNVYVLIIPSPNY